MIKERNDTLYHNFMFYDNGIFIGAIANGNTGGHEYLKYMVKNELDFNSRIFNQGTYKIIADSAVIIRFVSPGYSNTWAVFEHMYKIIDRNTLKYIYSKNIGQSNHPAYKDPKYFEDVYAKFVYVDSIPESSSWLKNEEWMKCD